MPETKINIQSPFYKKYTATDLVAVVLNVYIYSGEKDTDKGSIKYTLVKEAVSGKNYVIFELSDIIKDYLEPTKEEPFNSNIDYVKWVQLEATLIIDGLVAENVSATTTKNTDVAVNMIGRDSLQKPFTYQIVGNPSNGTLGTVSGNVVVYTPNENYTGSDSFTYKIVRTEDSKESGVATASITVTNVVPDTVLIFRYRRDNVDLRYEDTIECANETRLGLPGVYTGRAFGLYEDYDVGTKLLDFDGNTLTSSIITNFTGFFFITQDESPNGVDEMVELGLDGDGDFAILDIQEAENIGDCITLIATNLAGPTVFSNRCTVDNYARYYSNRAVPEVGDIIYTDGAGTNVVPAGYYKVFGNELAIQIANEAGRVDSVEDCI